MISDEAVDKIIKAVTKWRYEDHTYESLRSAIDAATGHTKMVEALKAVSAANQSTAPSQFDRKFSEAMDLATEALAEYERGRG